MLDSGNMVASVRGRAWRGPISYRVSYQNSDRGARIDAGLRRVMDILIATVALIILAPLMILVSLAIFVTDPGPLFFAHRRIGHNGVPFPCLKFRTMVTDAQARLEDLLRTNPVALAEWTRDHKLRDDPRITAIGRFLRRSSLDELPQFINVLRGEMSIVGPRPIVHEEVVRYGRYFAFYKRVKPGITGLWQVSGRNDITYRRRVALDVTYARTRSVPMDIRIMVRTVPAVLKSRGSY